MKTRSTKPTRRSSRLSLGNGVLLAGAVAGAVSLPALAGPEGQDVVHGSATFATDGSYTAITTSHIAIIDYTSFNIAAGETVQFFQPNANSRVLNRINGAAPTEIHGNLTANGNVYFANRAGVIFGAGAVLNVGSVYAAGGNISNSDFLSGMNRFTDVTGDVVNRGTIMAADSVTLVGHRVENFGVVTASNSVTMVSGNDVLIGRKNGRVFARIDNAANPDGGGGIVQRGAVTSRSGRVLMGVGDAFAYASYSGSSIVASDVEITGGEGSSITVAGEIDASDASAGGVGGTVSITGGLVHLDDAHVDASGDSGGGTVHIGGELRGGGELSTADNLYISEGSRISVDALRVGNGGEAIIYATGGTYFGGEVSARGGAIAGDGGFIEVSGKNVLLFRGEASTEAGHGKAGTLLLDPRDARIVVSGGTDTPGSSTVNFGDFIDNMGDPDDNSGANDATFNASVLENLLATNGNLLIEAHRDIIFESTGGMPLVIDVPGAAGAFSSADLTLTAGRSIELQAGTSIDLGTMGSFMATINSNMADADFRNGTAGPALGAEFIMDSTASITAGGGFTLVQDTNGGAFTAGDITLSTVNAANGSVAVTGTGGDIFLTGAISSNASNPGDDSAGAISLTTTGTIRVEGGATASLVADGEGGRVLLNGAGVAVGLDGGSADSLTIAAGDTMMADAATDGEIVIDATTFGVDAGSAISFQTGGAANSFEGQIRFNPTGNVALGDATSGGGLDLSVAALNGMTTERLFISGGAGTAVATLNGLNNTGGGAFENISDLRVALTAAGSSVVFGTTSTSTLGNITIETPGSVTFGNQLTSTGAGTSLDVHAGSQITLNAVVNAENTVLSTVDFVFGGDASSVVFNVVGTTQVINDGTIRLSGSAGAPVAGELELLSSDLIRFVSANGATQPIQLGGAATIGDTSVTTQGISVANSSANYTAAFGGAANRGVVLDTSAASMGNGSIEFSGINLFRRLAVNALGDVTLNTSAVISVSEATATGRSVEITSTMGDITFGSMTAIATAQDGILLSAPSGAIELLGGAVFLQSRGTDAATDGIMLMSDVRLDLGTMPAAAGLTIDSTSGFTTQGVALGSGVLNGLVSTTEVNGTGRTATFGGAVTADTITISGTSDNDTVVFSDTVTVGGSGMFMASDLGDLHLNGAGASLAATGGSVSIEADDFTLAGTLTADSLSIRQADATGEIFIGDASDAPVGARLIIDNAELARLNLTGALTIGDQMAAGANTVQIDIGQLAAGAFANAGGSIDINALASGGAVSVIGGGSSSFGTMRLIGETMVDLQQTVILQSGASLTLQAPTVMTNAIDGSASGTRVFFDTLSLAVGGTVDPTVSTTFLSFNNIIDIGGTMAGMDLDIDAATLANITGNLVFGDAVGRTTSVALSDSGGVSLAGRNVSLLASGAGGTVSIAPTADMSFLSLTTSAASSISLTGASAVLSTTAGAMSFDAPTLTVSNGGLSTVGGSLSLGQGGGSVNLTTGGSTLRLAARDESIDILGALNISGVAMSEVEFDTFNGGATGADLTFANPLTVMMGQDVDLAFNVGPMGTLTFNSVTTNSNSLRVQGGAVSNLTGTVDLGAGTFTATGGTIAIGADADVMASGADTQVLQSFLDTLVASSVTLGDMSTTAITSYGTVLDNTPAGQTVAGAVTFNTNGMMATDGVTFTGTMADAGAANAFTDVVVAGTGSGGVFIDSALNSNASVDVDSGTAGVVFGGGSITAGGTDQSVNLAAAGGDITSTAGNDITVTSSGEVVFQNDAVSAAGISISIDDTTVDATDSAIAGSTFGALTANGGALSVMTSTGSADNITFGDVLTGWSVSVTGGDSLFALGSTVSSTNGGINITGDSLFATGGTIISAVNGGFSHSGGVLTMAGSGTNFTIQTEGGAIDILGGLAINRMNTVGTFDTTAGMSAAGANITLNGGVTSTGAVGLTFVGGTGGAVAIGSGDVGTAMAAMGDISVDSAASVAITSAQVFADSYTQMGAGTFSLGDGSGLSQMVLSGTNGGGFGFEAGGTVGITVNRLGVLRTEMGGVSVAGDSALGGSIITDSQAILFAGNLDLNSASIAALATAGQTGMLAGNTITINGNLTATSGGSLIVDAGTGGADNTVNVFTVMGNVGETAMDAIGDISVTGAVQLGGDLFAQSFVMEAVRSDADTDIAGTATLVGANIMNESFIARGMTVNVGAIDASGGTGSVSLLGTTMSSVVSLGGDITTNNRSITLDAESVLVDSMGPIALNSGTAAFNLATGSVFDTQGQNVTITSNDVNLAGAQVLDSTMADDTLTFLGATNSTDFFLAATGGMAGTDFIMDAADLAAIDPTVGTTTFGDTAMGVDRTITTGDLRLFSDAVFNVSDGRLRVTDTLAIGSPDAVMSPVFDLSMTVNGNVELVSGAAAAQIISNTGGLVINGDLLLQSSGGNLARIDSFGGDITVAGNTVVDGAAFIVSSDPGDENDAGDIMLMGDVSRLAMMPLNMNAALTVSADAATVTDGNITFGGGMGASGALDSIIATAGDAAMAFNGSAHDATTQNYTAATFSIDPAAMGGAAFSSGTDLGNITFSAGVATLGMGDDLTITNANGSVTLPVLVVMAGDTGRTLAVSAADPDGVMAGRVTTRAIGSMADAFGTVTLTSTELAVAADVFADAISVESEGNIIVGAASSTNGSPNEITFGELGRLTAGTGSLAFRSTMGDVTTQGSTTVNNDLTFDAAGTATLGGAWTFGGTLNVVAPMVAINADITSTLASGSPAVDAVTITHPMSTLSPTIALGGSINAMGNVLLGNDRSVITVSGVRTIDTTSGNGSITLCGTIDRAGMADSLTLMAGSTGNSMNMGETDSISIGSITNADSITLTTTGSIRFKGTTYTSSGNQSYTAAAFLLDSSLPTITFDAGAGGVSFINGDITEAGGTAVGLSVIGSAIALNSVTTSFQQVYSGAMSSDTTVTLNGTLKTLGGLIPTGPDRGFGGGGSTFIQINGSLALTGDSVIMTGDAGDTARLVSGVTLGGPVTGGGNGLMVMSSGDVLLSGNATGLSNFDVTTPSMFAFEGVSSIAADSQDYTAAGYTLTTPAGMVSFVGNGVAFNGGGLIVTDQATSITIDAGMGLAAVSGVSGSTPSFVNDLDITATDVSITGEIRSANVVFAHTDVPMMADVINLGGGMGFVLDATELAFVANGALPTVNVTFGRGTNDVATNGAVALSGLTNGLVRFEGGTLTGNSDFSTGGAGLTITSMATLTGGTYATNGGNILVENSPSSFTNTTLMSSGGSITLQSPVLTLDGSTVDAGTGAIDASSGTIDLANAVLFNSTGTVTLGEINGQAAGLGDLTINAGSVTVSGGSIGLTRAINSFAVTSGAGVTLNSVTTASSQTYNANVTVNDNGVFSNTAGSIVINGTSTFGDNTAVSNAGGLVRFGGSTTLGGLLTVTNTGGMTEFGGTALVGSVTSDLVVNAGPGGTVLLPTVGSGGAFRNLTINGGTTTLNGDVTLLGGFTAGDVIGANRAFTATTGTGITFTGDADFSSNGNVRLIGGTGAVALQGLSLGAGLLDVTGNGASFLGDVTSSGDAVTTVMVNAGSGNIAFGGDVGGESTRMVTLGLTTSGELQFTDAMSSGQDVFVTNGFTLDTGGEGRAVMRTFGQTRIDSSAVGSAGSIVLDADLLGSANANDGFTFIVDRSGGAASGVTGTLDTDLAVIVISGNVSSTMAADRLSDLRLNFDGAMVDGRENDGVPFTPAQATIVIGDPSTFGSESNPMGENFVLNLDGDFEMGRNEKLTVLGSLDLNAASARLGDVNAFNVLDLSGVGSLNILLREPGTVVDGSTFSDDVGVDFVAQEIILPASITLLNGTGPTNPPPVFADRDASVPNAGGFSVLSFDLTALGLTPDQLLVPGGAVADLRAQGVSNVNVSEALAGAVPREAQSGDVGNDTSAGVALRDQLQDLGIFPKRTVSEYLELGDAQGAIEAMATMIEALRGRALYNDSLVVSASASVDGITTINRLQLELVADVLDTYNALFTRVLEDQFDENGNPMRVPAIIDVKRGIDNAVAGYFQQFGDEAEFDAEAFLAFIETNPQYAEARGYIQQAREFFADVELLGLAPYEFEGVVSTVLPDISDELDLADLRPIVFSGS